MSEDDNEIAAALRLQGEVGLVSDLRGHRFWSFAEAADTIDRIARERDEATARVEAMLASETTGDRTIIDNYFALGAEFGWNPNTSGMAMSPFDHILMWRDYALRETAEATARAERAEAALRWYANPDVYKPHPHGPAFDDRDLSFMARAVLPQKDAAP